MAAMTRPRPAAVVSAPRLGRRRGRTVLVATLSPAVGLGVVVGHDGTPLWQAGRLTGNPVGAVVVHDSYHVAANVHTYRSPIYLPADLDGSAERGGGSSGLALAGIWIVLAGTVVYDERRRLFPSQSRWQR